MARPCLVCGRLADGPRCPTHELAYRAPYRDPAYKRYRKEVQAGVHGPCVDCGAWTRLTVDHVVPKAAGGGNDGNLTVRCAPCNRAKSSGFVPPREQIGRAHV